MESVGSLNWVRITELKREKKNGWLRPHVKVKEKVNFLKK